MKQPGVTFAAEAEEVAPSSSPAPKGGGGKRLRYGRLLAGLSGGGNNSSTATAAAPPSPGADAPAAARTFNAAAAPARPALKSRSASGPGTAQPLYPHMTPDGGAPPAAPLPGYQAEPAPNPATGLVNWKTTGGSALASALGDPAIPPACPPALPNMPSSAATAHVSEPAAAAVLSATGAISNPLAVPDMPLMPTVSAAGAAAAAALPLPDASRAMPPCATADGTVQLSTPGGAAAKLAPAGTQLQQHTDSDTQRDQSTTAHKVATHPGGEWHGRPGSGADIEAADLQGLALESPKGSLLLDKQHHHHHHQPYDDDASRWARG